MVAEGVGLDRGIEHELVAQPIFELVTDARQREVLARRTIGAALEPDHRESRLGEFARHDAAGPAHADHDGVDGFHSLGHDRAPQEKSAIDFGSITTFLPRYSSALSA